MTESNKVKIKILASITFVLMLLLIVLDAEAGGNHGHDLNLTIEHPGYAPAPGVNTTTQVFTGMDSEEFDKGMAMSAAGDTCVFDYAPGWQGCVGGGWYASQDALNGSLVTRVDNFAVRVNLQTDIDFDEQAIGVGTSWHF